MPYIDDNDVVTCNLDALYCGDMLHEGYDESDFAPIVESQGTLMAANVPFVNLSEGTSAIASVHAFPAPAHPVEVRSGTLPGWDVVDRICGD